MPLYALLSVRNNERDFFFKIRQRWGWHIFIISRKQTRSRYRSSSKLTLSRKQTMCIVQTCSKLELDWNELNKNIMCEYFSLCKIFQMQIRQRKRCKKMKKKMKYVSLWWDPPWPKVNSVNYAQCANLFLSKLVAHANWTTCFNKAFTL